MYYNGRSARTTVQFEMPADNSSLLNFTVVNLYELVFVVKSPYDNTSLVYFSDIPMFMGNCTDGPDVAAAFPHDSFYSHGKKKVIVESCGKNVSLRAS